MRVFRDCLVAALVTSLSVSSTFAQSRHIVDPSAVAGLLRDQVEKQEADRAAVRATLDRPEVLAVASRVGFDVGRLQASIETMSASDVERAAVAARAVDVSVQSLPLQRSFVGGASTVTLSTTTIIIGLLVLILIIVAVD